MKRLEMQPDGWPCTLAECRPGHFLVSWADPEDPKIETDLLCFKSEYSDNNGFIHAFNEAGEYFHSGSTTETRNTIVQPIRAIWVEYES